MSLKLKTAPTEEPVAVDLIRQHLKLDTSDDDVLIQEYIGTAREFVENQTHRAMFTQTWTLWLDGFPIDSAALGWWDGVRQGALVQGVSSHIEIPRPPLVSVTHLKTYDTDDVATTFDSAGYFVDIASEPGRLALASGYTWPSSLRLTNAVEVEFVAGQAVTNIPRTLRHAVMLLTSHLYENREIVTDGINLGTLPTSLSELIASERVHSL